MFHLLTGTRTRSRPPGEPPTIVRRVGLLLAGALTAGLLTAIAAAAADDPPTALAPVAPVSAASAPVSLGQISATPDDRLFALAADHSAVYEHSDRGWTKVGGPAQDLYVGGAGVFVTEPETGKINKYDGEADHWTHVGEAGADFAVTSDRLYGLTPDRTAIFEWTGQGTDWTKIGGPAKDLHAGGAGLFATDPGTGQISRYNGQPDSWTKIGEAGAGFTVSDTRIYGLSPDTTTVSEWTGRGADWTKIGTEAGDLPSSEEKMQRLNELTAPGETATQDWFNTISNHLRGQPDKYGFNWTTNRCNSPAPDSVAGFDFANACIRHDFGYRNYREVLGEDKFQQTAKARVDAIFLQDLTGICQGRLIADPRTDASRRVCMQIAETYHGAVVSTGTG
ncbi:phospholipase A2 [Streptomyces sp. NPDC057638]|uniref:phospholipase A2 n=1 Tax=Streptomyces sp. NPDC057638 TaxID=3346190 RepID=UPI0036775360